MFYYWLTLQAMSYNYLYSIGIAVAIPVEMEGCISQPQIQCNLEECNKSNAQSPTSNQTALQIYMEEDALSIN